MPTYEYQCKQCGYDFDIHVSISEKERREAEHGIVCEQCGSDEVEQVFGGFSVLSGMQVRMGNGDAGACCGGGGCC